MQPHRDTQAERHTAMTIQETTELATKDLHTYHKNPRIGNIDTIAASLNANGQYRAIVVNRGTHTGRPMEVLAGNHTLMAARDLGWETITAHLIDVDEDQAARIVLADNRTSDLGTYDTSTLADMLTGLPDLDGTGYNTDDLDDLLAYTQPEAPSLDDLEAELGTFDETDLLANLTLEIMPDTRTAWLEHRQAFDNDDDALKALLA